ncbi:MAG: ribose-5-phosphate isomerase RpiA [Acidobacteria bacterium]|nr:ribose-5-phosphate isomerase RpiA [Acidobacteriota bacterium]
MKIELPFSGETASKEQREKFKQLAAEHAVEFVQSGMIVGLGTGSTAVFATRRIAQLLQEGKLKEITCYATSKATLDEAIRLNIPMRNDEFSEDVNLTIDGADEVDPEMNLIKGGGGALLREKIVAQASRRVIIVIDESKFSPSLGTNHALPIEVLAFGWRSQFRFLKTLGAEVAVRSNPDGSEFVTDSGNLILDCRFGPIANPPDLASRLDARAGIVEHGLFLGLATDLIVAGSNGIRRITK